MINFKQPSSLCNWKGRFESSLLDKTSKTDFLAAMIQSADLGLGFLKYNGHVTKQQQLVSCSCFYLLVSSFHK